jgi:pimeloyl-ACP methyl ester carboxylesterase
LWIRSLFFLLGRLLVLLAGAAFAAENPPRITFGGGVFRAQPASPEATLQVYVDGPSELPPVLGATSREEGALVFKPRFSLQAGMRYRAVYRESRRTAPHVEIFTIPKDVTRPPARVERIDPTADQVPENLLKLYLNFSAPMSRGEAYRFVRLMDESGRKVELPFLEIEQELWDREARRLTLLFDPGRVKRDLVPHNEVGSPLRAGASYTLVVDRGFPDAHGNPLEVETRKAFRVGPPDHDPPRIDDWRLDPPKAGGREPLVVAFPDPLDRALLERVIEIVGPSGEPVQGGASIDSRETRWSFTPSAPWKTGEYSLRALSILEDLAGNSLGQKFEVGVSEPRESRSPRVSEAVRFRVASADTRFATSRDGTRVAFDTTGSGPAVLLLHGGGQTRNVWRQAGYVERLARDFTVVSVDLRGNGESDKPATIAAYATKKLEEDILAVADAVGARSFSIWGFSYGANVGRYVAVASPRVKSMVYIGIPFGEAASGIFRETILGLRAKWAPILAADALGKIDTATLSEPDRATWLTGQVPLRIAWLSAMLEYPKVEPSDMKCPTLWIVGTANKDTMASVENYRSRLATTPVSLLTLDGATHPQEMESVDQTLPPALEFTKRHAQ